MRYLIDISEKDIKFIERNACTSPTVCGNLWVAVRHGKALPKEHGRLVDADSLSGAMSCEADLTDGQACYDSIRKLLDDEPTVVEEHKEDEK